MYGSGASGALRAAVTALVVAAFVGCGGSSRSRGSGGGDGDAGSGGSSTGGSSPNGGSGAVPLATYCNGQPCDAPLACCMATGQCFDPDADATACMPPEPDDDPQGRRPCASSSHCEPGEYCASGDVLCRGTGHCQSMSECGHCGDPSLYALPSPECRVCGCDGNTYPNRQLACSVGVNVVFDSHGAGCGETGMEGGAGASTIGPREFVVCGHDGHCPSGNFCCAMVGRCYPETDRDICAPGPDGSRIACKANENCNGFEYCAGEGCDGPGGCVHTGPVDECGVTLEPVCGCDGTTYTSAACAASRGVRVDFVGECGGE